MVGSSYAATIVGGLLFVRKDSSRRGITCNHRTEIDRQKSWSKEETWQHPAIFKFVDYIQHRDEITSLTPRERETIEHIALSPISEIPMVSPSRLTRANAIGIQTP